MPQTTEFPARPSGFGSSALSREEEALAQVGRTTVTRSVAWVLVAMFLTISFAVPVVQHVHEIRLAQAGLRDRLLPQAYDIFRGAVAAVRAGRKGAGTWIDRLQAGDRAMVGEIRRYETALEDESVMVRAVQPVLQSALILLGAGNEEAYPGRDGWLFYRRDVDYVMGAGFLEVRGGIKRDLARAADPRPAILDFRDQLARRGIELVVVPVPVKPSVQPERLTGARLPGLLQNRSYRQFVADLTRAGVLVYDLSAELERAKTISTDSYLATDTHWRPDTMQAAARGLANFVRDRVALPARPVPVVRREPMAVKNLGDIAVMLRLPPRQQRYRPETVTLDQVLGPNGALWQPVRDADVLLLGDSFSNIYSLGAMGWGESAGFAEHLATALGRPLDCLLRNDAGAVAARELLARQLARGDDRLAGKKLVIWEFAARELSSGDWKRIPLTVGTPAPRRFLVPPVGQTWDVSATLAAIAPAPRPGSVPYKDHLVAAHLVDVHAGGREISGGEAVVYLRSMQDGVWTPAAHLRAGQTVHLKLTPWAEVADRLDRINRAELGDEALQLEEPCWGELVPNPRAP